MIIREKKPFMNWMVKCLGEMPIIFIVFLLIGCTQNKTKLYDSSRNLNKDPNLAKVKTTISGENYSPSGK